MTVWFARRSPLFGYNPQMLVGRDELLTEIQRQLSARGHVRLVGPTGIGRTAILEALAVDLAARGRTVWRMTPTQGDRHIVHIGLSDLLNGLDTTGLPEPQAAAIAIVLRRADGIPDPTALRLGVLDVLRRAVDPLIIVDDAQWLDDASAEVLTFAMRRMGRELSLLTSRHRGALARAARSAVSTGALTVDRDAIEIVVPALESGHMVELLGAHSLTCRHASRVHAASGGNPRLALAIGSASAETRMPQHVTHICHEHLMEVPVPVRRLVLFVALAGKVSMTGLRRAGLLLAAEHAAIAEHAGLVTIDADENVTVQSGALATTAITDASASDVRMCHEVLARAADDEITRLWHTAMSATDPELAVPLAQARVAARAQGHPHRAAELALRAADLAPVDFDKATVISWLADAAHDASVAGNIELVRQALSRLERIGAPPVERARARLAYFDTAGQNVDGCDELLSKVLSEATGHPDLLSAARLRLAVRACIAESSPQRATVHARRAVQYAVVAGDQSAEVQALTYLARMQRASGDPAADETLSQALAVPVPPGVIRLHASPRFISAKHSFFDDRLEESRAELLALLPVAEATGTSDDQYEILRFLAEVEARMGRCTSARAHARRAITIAERTGMSPGPTWYSASVVELAANNISGTHLNRTADGVAYAIWKTSVGDVPPPTDDFSISLNPTSGSVNAGSSATATVNTSTTAGSAQTVNLSATGQGNGVTVSFNPTSVTSGNSSTMTISVAAGTPSGSHTITVKGQGSVSHNATYTLTVNGSTSPSPSPSTSTSPPSGRTFTNGTDYQIVDNRIFSPVTSTATGSAVSPVKLSITINHTCSEDLGISLIAPNGQVYAVKYSGSGNYQCTPFGGTRTYNVPVAATAAGTWQLRVTDYGPGDYGVLDTWSITL